MKNPLKKEDHTELIVAIAIGAVAAGALAYLFLTEGGGKLRGSLKHKLKDSAKNLAAGIVSDKTGIKKTTVKQVADHVVE